MSALLSALILLGLSEAGAAILQGKPSEKDLESIQASITEGRRLHKEIVKKRRERAVWEYLKRAPIPPKAKAEYQRKMDTAKKEIDDLAEKRDLSWDSAISDAFIAIGIDVSDWPHGTYYGRSPHFIGGEYTWRVRAGENTGRWTKNHRDERVWIHPTKIDPRIKQRPIAAIGPDGTAILFPETFTSPRRLIFAILHELRHFDQMTTPEGNNTTISESEVAARNFEKAMSRIYPWKNPKEEQDFKDALDVSIAEWQALVDADKPLKNTDKLPPESYLNSVAEHRADFDVDLDPVRQESDRVRDAVEKRALERHVGHLKALAVRWCAEETLSQSDFDQMSFFRDRSRYLLAAEEAAAAATAEDCESETYATYLGKVSTGERLLAPKKDVRTEARERRRSRHLRSIRELADRGCAGEQVPASAFESVLRQEVISFYSDEKQEVPRRALGAQTCSDTFYEELLAHLMTNDRLSVSVFEKLLTEHFDRLMREGATECGGDTVDYSRFWYFQSPYTYRRELDRFRASVHAAGCHSDTYIRILSSLIGGEVPRRAPKISPPTAAPPSPPPPTAPRVQDPPNALAPKPRVPPEGERALSELVKKACENPGGFKSTADFSWFPAPGYPFTLGPRDPQDYCQRSLWDYLMTVNAQGGKLDMQDVSHRAWGYQPRTPPPGGAAPDCPRRQGDRCVPELGN